MLSCDVVIRAFQPSDEAAWLDMWKGYCAFYEFDAPQAVTHGTWERLITGDTAIAGLIAVNAVTGAALGLAHYVVHPFTWSEHPACYLEDLFVRPDVRGSGVGHALIERLIALCEHNRWARLYWLTRETNAAARRLYDRFAQRDDFVRYDIAIRSAPAE
jgi:GNAT superfamily N-acetyltransferase